MNDAPILLLGIHDSADSPRELPGHNAKKVYRELRSRFPLSHPAIFVRGCGYFLSRICAGQAGDHPLHWAAPGICSCSLQARSP